MLPLGVVWPLVVGNGDPGEQISTGALREAIGFLQRPQSYPPASEGNTEPYHPEFATASAEVVFEQLGTADTDTVVSSVVRTDPHNILPAMDYNPHDEPTVTADECQQRRCHVSAKCHLVNRATMKQRQSKLFQTVNHAQIIWNSDTKPKGILGGHINIRSILSKIDQIQNLLIDSNLDFLCMSETWLTSNVPTDLINIPGYICYRKDRPKGRGGGVLIYIREQFKILELDLNVNLESLGLNVILSSNMKFNIVVLYNPPSHEVNFYDELKRLLSIVDKSCECMLFGDFNINWLDKRGKTKLKSTMEKFKYIQLIDRPTRVTRKSETLIDLIFTNRPERVIKTYNLITGLSDHNMTLIIRKLNKKRLVYHNKTENYTLTTGIPKSKMADFEHELKETNWERVTKEPDIDHSANTFASILHDLINKHTKTWKSKPKKKSLQWFNSDILQLTKERDLALKRSLMTKTRTDHFTYTSLRNKVVSELRKAKTNHFYKLIEEANGNSSKLWQHINRLTNSSKQKHPKINCLKVCDEFTENNESIANGFNQFLLSL